MRSIFINNGAALSHENSPPPECVLCRTPFGDRKIDCCVHGVGDDFDFPDVPKRGEEFIVPNPVCSPCFSALEHGGPTALADRLGEVWLSRFPTMRAADREHWRNVVRSVANGTLDIGIVDDEEQSELQRIAKHERDHPRDLVAEDASILF